MSAPSRSTKRRLPCESRRCTLSRWLLSAGLRSLRRKRADPARNLRRQPFGSAAQPRPGRRQHGLDHRLHRLRRGARQQLRRRAPRRWPTPGSCSMPARICRSGPASRASSTATTMSKAAAATTWSLATAARTTSSAAAPICSRWCLPHSARTAATSSSAAAAPTSRATTSARPSDS